MSLKDDIKNAASQPKRGKEDELEIEQRSIYEMIEADKYLRSRDALKKGCFGFKMFKIKSPGTQGN